MEIYWTFFIAKAEILMFNYILLKKFLTGFDKI